MGHAMAKFKKSIVFLVVVLSLIIATGSFAGIILGRRTSEPGMILGPELIVDGDCSTDSFSGEAPWTYDASNEEYDISGAHGNVYLDQNNVIDGDPVGRTFRTSFTIKNYVSGNARIWVSCCSGMEGEYRSGNGTYVEDITVGAGSTSDNVYIHADNTPFVGSVDDISVKEILGTCTSYTEKDEIYTGNNTGDAVFGDLDSEESLAFPYYASSTYYLSNLTLRMKKTGSPTGTLTIYIYTPASTGTLGPPDDRQATFSDTIDVSTLTTSNANYTISDIDAPVSVNSSDDPYLIVVYFNPTFADNSNDIQVVGDGYIGGSSATYTLSGAPAAIDSATTDSWSTLDDNGQPVYRGGACE